MPYAVVQLPCASVGSSAVMRRDAQLSRHRGCVEPLGDQFQDIKLPACEPTSESAIVLLFCKH